MRILHTSDTHGVFPELKGTFDCILHTGDFLPNSKDMHDKNLEFMFQLKWLRSNASLLRDWAQGKTLLYVLGNHDFISPEIMEEELNSYCLKAINITNKLVKYLDYNFYGFPYISITCGTNYELNDEDLKKEVCFLAKTLNNTYVDVLALHAPLYGLLDTFNNKNIGNNYINNMAVNKDMMPQFIFHGHCHESHGITINNGSLISNAATIQNIIQL